MKARVFIILNYLLYLMNPPPRSISYELKSVYYFKLMFRPHEPASKIHEKVNRICLTFEHKEPNPTQI